MHLVSAHRADPYASVQKSTSSSSSPRTSSSLLSRLLRRKKHIIDSSASSDTSSRRSSIDSQTPLAPTTSISKSAPLDHRRLPLAPSSSDDVKDSDVVIVPTSPCHTMPLSGSTQSKASHKKVDNEPYRSALVASSLLRA